MGVVEGQTTDNADEQRTFVESLPLLIVLVCILVMPRHVPGLGVVSGQTMWAGHAPLWGPSPCCSSRWRLRWPPCRATSCPYPISQPPAPSCSLCGVLASIRGGTTLWSHAAHVVVKVTLLLEVQRVHPREHESWEQEVEVGMIPKRRDLGPLFD